MLHLLTKANLMCKSWVSIIIIITIIIIATLKTPFNIMLMETKVHVIFKELFSVNMDVW